MTAALVTRRGGLGLALTLLLPVALAAQAAVPLLVLTRNDLVRSGRPELAAALQSLLPSLNLPRPSNAGGSEHSPPTSLRGLGADQFLVLINGRRRLENAFLTVSGIIGRGQTVSGLDAIPLSAVERIEVLGDRAAARYGSGAVAGVINIVLRATGPGELTAQTGVTTEGDGAGVWAGGSHTVRWGANGFVMLAAELGRRGASNRAMPDLRPQYFPGDPRNSDPARSGRVTQRFGEPEARTVAGFLNVEKPLRPALTAYGTLGLTRRSGRSGELWGRPLENRTLRSRFPDGFLPLLAPVISDGSLVAGLRGTLLGWSWDASGGYARNSFRLGLEQTANVSLGPPGPTRFQAGMLRADQLSGDLELSRRIGLPLLPPLSVVLGAGYRSDGFQIQEGELDSWRYGGVLIPDGPNALGLAQPGAQGFRAFRPTDRVLARRDVVGGYGELSTVIRRRLTLGATGRLDFYPRLGNLAVYQLSARLDPVREIALSGGFGSGVRVPSLAQSSFSSSATVILPEGGFDERTVPVNDPMAVVLGARPLTPERSRNRSAGIRVLRENGLSLGAEYYRIEVRDRIILSGWFDDPGTRQFLAQQGFIGMRAARFFSNALATRTTGIDAAAAYRFGVGGGSLRVSAALNHHATHVTGVDSIKGVLTPFQEVFFDRVERARIELGQPRDNLILAAELTRKAWRVGVRAQRFGAVSRYGAPADGSLDQRYGAKWVSDLSVSYQRRRLTLTAGVDNLLNAYPDRNRFGDAANEGNSNFGMFPYPENSPFGFTGRLVYLRAMWR